METRFYFGVEIDSCPKCGGMWLDDGELVRLGQAAAGVLREIDTENTPSVPRVEPRPERQMRCPRDGEFMAGYQFAYNSGILLDTCPKCNGVFIDHGELTQISEFKAGGGIRRGPDPAKVAALRAKRHAQQFGDPNQPKLSEEAAIMLSELQGKSAVQRERDESLLRFGYHRHSFGVCILGAIIDGFFDTRYR